MNPAFRVHERLEADTRFVADWTLSRLLLADDCRFPWLILVPRRSKASEIHDLTRDDRALLMEEIARAGRGLLCITGLAKINIGTLGNIVPQLHVHIVGRHPRDTAWPGPVWGQGKVVPYFPSARATLIGRLREEL